MPKLIPAAVEVLAAGEPPKTIREFFGRVATGSDAASVAHMISPEGWREPGQRPDFDEITVVLRGCLRVETEADGTFDVCAGQAIWTRRGEWIRYSSPEPGGAEYIAVCLPAFSPETVNRDAE